MWGQLAAAAATQFLGNKRRPSQEDNGLLGDSAPHAKPETLLPAPPPGKATGQRRERRPGAQPSRFLAQVATWRPKCLRGGLPRRCEPGSLFRGESRTPPRRKGGSPVTAPRPRAPAGGQVINDRGLEARAVRLRGLQEGRERETVVVGAWRAPAAIPAREEALYAADEKRKAKSRGKGRPPCFSSPTSTFLGTRGGGLGADAHLGRAGQGRAGRG